MNENSSPDVWLQLSVRALVEIESSGLKTYQQEKGLAAGLDRGASHSISHFTAITSGVAALFLVSHLKRILIEAI